MDGALTDDAVMADAGDPRRLLAIDIGGTKIALAVADPAGRVVARTELSTASASGARRVIGRMAAAGQHLLAKTSVAPGQLAVVSAVSPGLVLEDRVLFAPNNEGWESVALARELRQAFGVERTVIGNDVKAAALAEARQGRLAGAGTGLYLNLGTGLAAAAVVDGRVLHGAHGVAGEIGYQLTGRPGEKPFSAGGAPLEDLVGGNALAKRASELVGRAISAKEAFGLAQSDGRIRELLADAMSVLARHIANMSLALDPEVIAIGGGMAESAEAILPVLRAELQRSVPYPPEVVIAHFKRDAALVGAVLGAVDEIGGVARTR
jgi:predicted NBD/HSP70 family sugar kinase